MKRNPLFSFAVLTFSLLSSAGAAASAKPNIVFIIADDLGWADVAFHGGNTPTPYLDKLARESVELTQHYVAPVCSPTRTGLMTGRVWSRYGVNTPDNRRALPWDTVTLPRMLKGLGYETALTGKWHLGSKAEWGPNHFGFDHSYGSLAGGVGPYDHFYKEGEFMRTWHRNGKLITEEGHVTDLITREAVKWIGGRGNAPFFLYVPYTAVHLPLKEPKEWLDRVPKAITGEIARQYSACIMHLDDAVGRILAALEQAGKRENTIVVFTSDNGGSWAQNHMQTYPKDNYPEGKIPGNNLPFRGQKGDLYDGGIHVATIVSWPGKLRAGKVAHPMHIVDWLPTFSALVGHKPERDLKWDGVDMWPSISGTAKAAPARLLYWVGPSQRAVRDGDWKLIVPAPRGANAKKGKADGRPELFDLSKDPYEKTDLAAKRPEKVEALSAKLALMAKADGDAVVKE